MIQKFKNGKSPEVLSTITLENVLNEIRTGGSHKTYVEGLRLMDKSNPLFDLIKMSQIPSVRFNFHFNKKASNDNIIGPTGYIYVDVDNCTEIKKSDFITACWTSVSGTGLGILVKVEGLTVDNYRATYDKVTDIIGVKSDSGARKATQQTILSYDPQVYYNSGAECVVAVNLVAQVNSSKKKLKPTFKYPKDFKLKENINLRFDEIRDQFEGNSTEYIVYEGDKKELCVPYLPKSIAEGKRNKMFFYYASQIAALNTGINNGLLKSLLTSANSKTLKPLPEEEISKISQSVCSKLQQGSLRMIKNQQRRVLFHPESNLTKVEKIRIANKVVSKIRREKREIEINEVLENWDFEELGNITKSKLTKVSGISLSTIRRYWSTFQDFIETLNLQNLKEAVNEVVTKVKVKISRAFKKAVSIFKTPNTDVSSNIDFYSGNNVTPVPLILQT